MKLIRTILMSSVLLLFVVGCEEDKKVDGEDFINTIMALNKHNRKEFRKVHIKVAQIKNGTCSDN